MGSKYEIVLKGATSGRIRNGVIWDPMVLHEVKWGHMGLYRVIWGHIFTFASRSIDSSVAVVSLFADAFVSAVGVVAVSRGITFVGTGSAFVDVRVAGSSGPSGVTSADGLVGIIQ
jgi:hypothetical protein